MSDLRESLAVPQDDAAPAPPRAEVITLPGSTPGGREASPTLADDEPDPDPAGVFPPARYRTIHGYRRAYRLAGSGPPVLLLHGIGDSSLAFRDVIPRLARDHLVIAPDLLGHGHSEKPRADYSVGGFANAMRDLLSVLGVDRVTVIGHSLGAGVAMQFAYQYPERTDRLVLIGSGGVGRAVHPSLRLLTLPGTAFGIAALNLPGMQRQARLLVTLARATGTAIGLDGDDLLRVISALPDGRARAAFTRTLRSAVDWRGQHVTMLDRCYLAAGMPTLILWGERDAVVPCKHAFYAHQAMPGSRLEIFEGAGHFPWRADLDRFFRVLDDFVDSTEPANWSDDRWREQLRLGRDGVGGTTTTAGSSPVM